jgi:hypothetical protein
VPYLVESLTDVDEGRGAEAFVFQIVVDFVDCSVVPSFVLNPN